MHEDLHRRIEDTLLSRFPTDAPVTASQLAVAPVPAGLGHFLSRSLERRVHLEIESWLNQSDDWLEADEMDRAKSVQLIASELLPFSHFSPTDWKKVVGRAVGVHLAFLQEPARALAEFAFPADAHSLSSEDLQRRTGYFVDYPYMGKSVDAWLSQRGGQPLDRTAFESAMRHLDSRLTADYTADQWMDLMQPMVDLLQFAGIQPAGLPVVMVTGFFEAKERPIIAALIRSAAAVHRAEMITLGSLRDIVQKGLENEEMQRQTTAQAAAAAAARDADQASMSGQPSESGQPAGSGPSEDAGDSGSEERHKPETQSVPKEQDQDDTALPLWKRFQQRMDTPAQAEAASGPQAEPLWKSFESPKQHAEEAATTAAYQDFEDQDQPPAQTTARSVPPEPDPAPPVPIREAPRVESQHIVLGTAVRSRERFIRDLFGGEEATYTDVMEDLAAAPDWSTASSIIADRIFRPYQVDIYSDVAVDFTNAVEARYSGFTS